MNNEQLVCLELDTLTGDVKPIEFNKSIIGFSKQLSKVLQYENPDRLIKFIKQHKLDEYVRNHLYATWKSIKELKENEYKTK